jgi:hypothetical protein
MTAASMSLLEQGREARPLPVPVVLGWQEGWRIVRHPIAVIGVLLMIVVVSTEQSVGARARFELLVTGPTFFYGVFTYFAANLVASRDRRSHSGELLAATPAAATARVTGLCLAALVPALVCAAFVATGHALLTANDAYGYLAVPTVWHLAQGPLTVLGGALLGVMVARLTSVPGVALLVMLAMIAYDVWLGGDSMIEYQPLATYVAWAAWGDGTEWAGLIPGSAFWHDVYLLGCARWPPAALSSARPRTAAGCWRWERCSPRSPRSRRCSSCHERAPAAGVRHRPATAGCRPAPGGGAGAAGHGVARDGLRRRRPARAARDRGPPGDGPRPGGGRAERAAARRDADDAAASAWPRAPRSARCSCCRSGCSRCPPPRRAARTSPSARSRWSWRRWWRSDWLSAVPASLARDDPARSGRRPGAARCADRRGPPARAPAAPAFSPDDPSWDAATCAGAASSCSPPRWSRRSAGDPATASSRRWRRRAVGFCAPVTRVRVAAMLPA